MHSTLGTTLPLPDPLRMTPQAVFVYEPQGVHHVVLNVILSPTLPMAPRSLLSGVLYMAFAFLSAA